MGIDLTGTVLSNNSGLVATAGVGQVMKMGNTGILQRYNLGQPMFRATAAGTAAGVNLGTSAWVPVVLNSASPNIGSCYNTSNGRFTVPVSGVYLVTACTYFTVDALGNYIHPMFWVNGSSTLRRPAAGGLHRMRGHGVAAGHSVDGDAMEIISLIAGDYVNHYNYCGGAITYYPQYSRFEGYLLA